MARGRGDVGGAGMETRAVVTGCGGHSSPPSGLAGAWLRDTHWASWTEPRQRFTVWDSQYLDSVP